MSQAKPRVGISACLLGKRVRYNGDHKYHEWLAETLNDFVTFVPLCPEVEMGMGVPRESVRLVRDLVTREIRMLGNESGRNYAPLAARTARTMLARDLELDGCILKKDSPSCGLERVKVYGKNNIPMKVGSGFFAAALRERFPLLPVTEEGRLSDPVQREHFVTRVFAHHRLYQLVPSGTAIQKFHQAHKLLLMAHSPASYSVLGRLAAKVSKLPPRRLFAIYSEGFLRALEIPSTQRKRFNALQHAFGYFKTFLEPREKAQILLVLEEYRRGEVPLAAPLALIEYLIRRFEDEYLEGQAFFDPYPKKLALRIGI